MPVIIVPFSYALNTTKSRCRLSMKNAIGLNGYWRLLGRVPVLLFCTNAQFAAGIDMNINVYGCRRWKAFWLAALRLMYQSQEILLGQTVLGRVYSSMTQLRRIARSISKKYRLRRHFERKVRRCLITHSGGQTSTLVREGHWLSPVNCMIIAVILSMFSVCVEWRSKQRCGNNEKDVVHVPLREVLVKHCSRILFATSLQYVISSVHKRFINQFKFKYRASFFLFVKVSFFCLCV